MSFQWHNSGVGRYDRTNSRDGHRVSARAPPRPSADFLLHMLNHGKSDAELKGVDVDCLVFRPTEQRT